MDGKFYPPPKRSSFWHIVVPGRYSSRNALPLLQCYFRQLEKDLASELSQQSIAYWIHLYRRISPESIGIDKRLGVIGETRSILEAAMQKHSQLTPCSRIGLSNQVDPSKILGGMLLDERIPKEIRDQFREWFEKEPSLVLLEFGLKELRQFYRIEALAHEIWSTIGKIRIISKGASLIVHSDIPYISIDCSKELDRLVTFYDGRKDLLAATSTGTVFGTMTSRRKGKELVLLPLYNIEHIPVKKLNKYFKDIDVHYDMIGDNQCFNFIWAPFEIKQYYNAHLPFSKSFLRKHGLAFEHIVAVISAMLDRVISSWIHDIREITNYWQRGYKLTQSKDSITKEIEKWLPTTIERLDLRINSKDIKVSDVISFIELTPDKRINIDLATQGPHYMILPFSDGSVFIDYAWITDFFRNLFYDVKLDDHNFKGTMLEIASKQHSSPLTSKQLHAVDKTSKQIDASSAIDKLLLIIECRAKGISFGFYRGDITAINYRNDFIREGLSDVDNKASWLASHPLGTNYDIRKFDYILGLVVTPFKEYIPSLDDWYWIKEDVPRVLTPWEIKDKLKGKTFLNINQNSPNVFHISK